MLLEVNITSYNEPKSVINGASALTSFTKVTKSLFWAVILTPLILIIALVYYPIAIIALSYLNKISSKLLGATREEHSTLNYEEANLFYSKIQDTINRLKKVAEDSEIKDVKVLMPITKRITRSYNDFLEMDSILKKDLFIDTSEEVYTDKEEDIFSELRDFFGESEEYKKDTFHQLKKETAEA